MIERRRRLDFGAEPIRDPAAPRHSLQQARRLVELVLRVVCDPIRVLQLFALPFDGFGGGAAHVHALDGCPLGGTVLLLPLLLLLLLLLLHLELCWWVGEPFLTFWDDYSKMIASNGLTTMRRVRIVMMEAHKRFAVHMRGRHRIADVIGFVVRRAAEPKLSHGNINFSKMPHTVSEHGRCHTLGTRANHSRFFRCA